ncbi:MAG: spermidine synthase [Candidatus Sedimenticola sp. (ex Thyasira tokunagai)]
MTAVNQRLPPWFAIGLLSAGALAYEVLLMRLFSQIHWHSLVGLIISLALLGYGASGTFITLLRQRLLAHYEHFFVLNALLFGIGGILAFYLASRLPLNPMAMAWDGRQLLHFIAIYLLLSLPFFAVANAIGITLWRFPGQINRVYAADLLGAGLGAALVIALLFILTPSDTLHGVALTGLLAAITTQGITHKQRLALVFVAALGLCLLPSQWLQAPTADYKALAQSLAVKGAKVTVQQSNPLGVITLVESPEAPFRHAPGLSLITPTLPPEQTALFVDGEVMGVQYRLSSNTAHLDYLISALGYALLEKPRVLLAGAHDGSAVAQALAAGATQVHVVEANPLLAELLADELTSQPVVIHPVAWRRFLREKDEEYDLIQLSLGDALGGIAGLQAQQENYRYTVEAFRDVWRHLTERGVISITRGLQMPPRGSLKLISTVTAALRQEGVVAPELHLALVRSWNTVSLLLARTPLSAQQRQAIRHFSQQRMFDLVYLADIRPEELNRYHKLARPSVYEGVATLLTAQAPQHMETHPFIIAPATDDRPYFNRFTRLSELIGLLQRPGRAGLAQIDWGYFMLLTALLIALLSSIVLILLPLWWRRQDSPTRNRRCRGVVLYFGAIGLAFLFIEIAFIQRFQLFLGAPIYAVAVVLGGFLLAAAAGSKISHRLACRYGTSLTLTAAICLIALITIVYLYWLPALFAWPGPLPIEARTAICLILIAPLGMAMGMPFPLGLSSLGDTAPQLIPWAWGINGCASVISALLAPLLAMEIGFSGVILLATLFYFLALAASRLDCESKTLVG